MRQSVRFDGRVAIVTGAGAGLGREYALLLADRGARVIVNDIVASAAESVVQEITAAGGKALAVIGSVDKRAVAEAMVQAAVSHWGQIDIVINNAGVEVFKEFDSFTDEDLTSILNVHLWGSWRLSQLAWPHMKAQRYGRIMLVCSPALFGMSNNAAYTTAKGALLGLSKALAAEGKEHGIQANALAPMAMTDMARKHISDEATLAWMAEKFPPSHPPAVVAWLLHEDCDVSGEYITAYGPSFGRVVFGETRGAYCPGVEFTPEVVRDHFADAWDVDKFLIPESFDDGMAKLMALRGSDSVVISDGVEHEGRHNGLKRPSKL
jgi:NAD(P)-dependent dehydrogenase (short-subunit alcohol dehydrogenase family)